MSDRARIKPIAIIICREIRTDQRGVETFVGVINHGAWLYYGTPRVHHFSFSVVMEVLESGDGSFEIEVTGDPVKEPLLLALEKQGVVKEHPGEYQSASAVDIPITLIMPGYVYFRWRQSSSDPWEVLRVIRVKQKPMPTAMATDLSASSMTSTVTGASSASFTPYSSALKRRP